MMQLIKKLISSFFINTEYISPLNQDLKDKVVIITGATGGVGKALVEVLAREGANLVVTSRAISKDTYFSNSKKMLVIDADITNKADIHHIVEKTKEKFAKVNVLINNAGAFADKAVEEFVESEYDAVMDTNVKGLFMFSQAVVPVMKIQKSGLIINIGSKISHNTNVSSHKTLYAMSKYAVEGFSFALNKELKEYGVRVTCLMPGTINTFVSTKSKQYLSPFDIGQLALFIIKNSNIDFESIIFKSVKQNI